MSRKTNTFTYRVVMYEKESPRKAADAACGRGNLTSIKKDASVKMINLRKEKETETTKTKEQHERRKNVYVFSKASQNFGSLKRKQKAKTLPPRQGNIHQSIYVLRQEFQF